MVPAFFIRVPQWPLSLNGKLDRSALPNPVSYQKQKPYIAPRTTLEQLLVDIWSEVLQQENISIFDDFFALGGNSLSVVRLLGEINQAGWQCDMEQFQQYPTISALAATLQLLPEEQATCMVSPGIPVGCQHITAGMLPLVSLSEEDIACISARTPGGAGNIDNIYPLTPLQAGMLFHHQLNPQHDIYLLETIFSAPTREHLNAMIAALQKVIDRHDILRTAILWRQVATPVQVVYRTATLPVQESDSFEAVNGIELETAPLLQATVVSESAHNRWLLRLTVHHMISDHTSFDLLLSEIEHLLQGQALPPVIPFYHKMSSQLSALHQQAAHHFFTRMLAEVEEPTLPLGLTHIHGDGRGIVEKITLLPPDLTESLYQSARQWNISVATVLHVIWARVIAGLLDRQDVVFGTVLSGRMRQYQYRGNALGPYMNTLPVRVNLSGKSIVRCLRETQQILFALVRYEDVSLTEASGCCNISAALPLFSTLFNYFHTEYSFSERVQKWDAEIVLLCEEQERTNYPITFSIEDAGNRISLKEQVERSVPAGLITDCFQQTLTQLLFTMQQDPEGFISHISILPEVERERVLTEWNRTQTHYPSDLVPYRLTQQALATPQQTALLFAAQTLSYGELERLSSQLAHALQAQGVGPESRVAVCMERSFEMVISLLAILRAGGAYVPLDPEYPAQRLAYMLEDSQPVLLLTQKSVNSALPVTLPVLYVDCRAWQYGHYSDTAPRTPLVAHNLAYVIYTSGSTGKP
ncbi:MAG: condensation domain-containing protein, partial [Enterobacteriaceae bacterium]